MLLCSFLVGLPDTFLYFCSFFSVQVAKSGFQDALPVVSCVLWVDRIGIQVLEMGSW